jgi:hypothetical protein
MSSVSHIRSGLSTRCISLLIVGGVALVSPAAARAQSAISGLVTDTSGAVLPGVTVEASSPAIIEGARTVVTDGQGRYQLDALRPGVYKVTFSLEGFTALVRDGVELAANFTAPINVQLRVGSLEETITVSGQSPVVDVQRTTRSEVVTSEQLNTLPTGRTLAALGVIVPGMKASAPDVGGTQGMQQTHLSIQGSNQNDNSMELDGININCSSGTGIQNCNYPDDTSYQEVVFTAVGGTADTQTSGVRMNVIPKEGGNAFHGMGSILFSDSNFYSQNYNDELKAQGLSAPGRLEQLEDYSGQLGGPLVKNRVWFFHSDRWWRTNKAIPDTFDEQGNPGVDDNLLKGTLLRLTQNVNSANKLSLYYSRNPRFRGHRLEPGTEPRASQRSITWAPYVAQVKLTSTLSSKMLIESGWAQNRHFYGILAQPEVAPTDIARQDLLRGTLKVAPLPQSNRYIDMNTLVGSVSYITGTHSLKAGVQYRQGFFDQKDFISADLVQQYQNGVPFQVTVYNTPIDRVQRDYKPDLGLYIQDSFTTRRLTVNAGVRFDKFNGFLDRQTSPAGRFVPARDFAPIENLPNWKNVSPRVGISYDLFGDGKTALKFSAGRYVAQDNVSFVSRYAPLTLQSDARTWTDTNRNDIAEDSEIGPSRNRNFGLAAGTNTADPDIERPTNTLVNVAVQQELFPGIALTGSYYHRSFTRISWTENRALTLADYTLLRVADPRDNGQTIPVYNLAASKVGLVDNFDTTSDENYQKYDGVDAVLSLRLGRRMNLYGGVASGRTVGKTCEVPNPNSLLFCDQSQFDIPFRTQYKLSGSYLLPGDFLLGGVFQSVPGNERAITWLVTRAVVPSLTVSSVSVPLVQPGEAYYPRLNQLDLRVEKRFHFGRSLVVPQLDIFNVGNTATILTQNNTFGPSLGQVRTILDGRIVRLGMRVEF